MTVSLSLVHVYVDDPDTALVFYRDTLGLSVANDVANGPYRWVTLVSDKDPSVSIVLSQPQAGRSEENGAALAALLAKGELVPIQLRADDLDATFEKIAGSGAAEVVQEPASQPWGARDCAVRDPAGNLIRISQA